MDGGLPLKVLQKECSRGVRAQGGKWLMCLSGASVDLGEHGVLSQVPGSEAGERGYRGEHFIVCEVL